MTGTEPGRSGSGPRRTPITVIATNQKLIAVLPMRIEWHEGLTRFLVWSEKNKDPNSPADYLVDLEENCGIGKCDCLDFKCHKQKDIIGNDKSEAARERKRCKHIRACRELLGMHLVNTLVRKNLEASNLK
jgi:hypothetical protein